MTAPVPTAPNPSTAQARVLVDELARGGLTDAVVCPGSRSTALAIALHEDPRIRTHVHPDERSAAFVALGLGRATGRPAAVLVTSGTAVANLHPAVLEADHGGVPLLLLTADRPPELRGTGANQTIDQVGLFGGAVRFSVDLGVAGDRPDALRTWRDVAARCIAEATGLAGPPGPVQCNVPFREPTVPVGDDGRTVAAPFTTPLDGRGAFDPWVDVRPAARLPSELLLAELVTQVAGVERGLLVVGGDAALSAAAATALASATGWPLLAEGHAPARMSHRALRAPGWLVSHPEFAPRHRADLVLRFGRTTVIDGGPLSDQRVPQWLVEPFGRWADPARSIARLIVADADALAAGLTARLAGPTSSDWSDRWQAADAAAGRAIDAALDGDAALGEQRVARDLVRALPRDVPLVVGSSLPVRDLDRTVDARPQVRIHASRGVSGIDGFTATTLGVALGSGGRAVGFCGDLTLLHDSNGPLLDAAAPYEVTLVVVANGGGAIFDHLPPARHAPSHDRLFVTPHGRRIGDLARLHQAEHELVTDPGALAARLAAPSARPLRILEVPSDRAQEVTRRAALRSAVDAAITAVA